FVPRYRIRLGGEGGEPVEAPVQKRCVPGGSAARTGARACSVIVSRRIPNVGQAECLADSYSAANLIRLTIVLRRRAVVLQASIGIGACLDQDPTSGWFGVVPLDKDLDVLYSSGDGHPLGDLEDLPSVPVVDPSSDVSGLDLDLELVVCSDSNF